MKTMRCGQAWWDCNISNCQVGGEVGECFLPGQLEPHWRPRLKVRISTTEGMERSDTRGPRLPDGDGRMASRVILPSLSPALETGDLECYCICQSKHVCGKLPGFPCLDKGISDCTTVPRFIEFWISRPRSSCLGNNYSTHSPNHVPVHPKDLCF